MKIFTFKTFFLKKVTKVVIFTVVTVFIDTIYAIAIIEKGLDFSYSFIQTVIELLLSAVV